MAELALFGGPKTIAEPFPPYNTIGREEIDAAIAVLETGKLSQFFGSWSDKFFGGPNVQQFERAWAEYFDVEHTVSMNSWTSGLIAAVGALGIEPGDEVIVTPWTMCASATAILMWNAIPVFADIETETFNLDPAAVERAITPQTKAIMVADIFGHPARLDELMAIARRHNLKVIEDAAQAPGAWYHNKFAGTVADVGGFSLNYHKHIHTGEGGMCVTNNPDIAERLQLIRNHGEAVVAKKGVENIANILGFNFRLGEVEAAIGIEQLKRLAVLVERRYRTGIMLNEALRDLPGLQVPVIRDDCTHSFYIYAFTIESDILGVTRERLVAALQAEGVPWIYGGYQNVHLLPMFQKRIAYGGAGFPWTSDIYHGNVSYERGICPNAERLHDKDLICLQLCQHNYTDEETKRVIDAFYKVWKNLDMLQKPSPPPGVSMASLRGVYR